MNNTVKTTFLMVLLFVLFWLVGNAIGGRSGGQIALVLALAMNLFAYFYSDKIALAAYKAKPVSSADAPEVYRIVKKLTLKAGLPMPKIYIIPTDAANAFATGRNPSHAAVAVTAGILKILSEEELAGVLGHELAHVKHRDILTGTIVATFAGAIMFLASMARWGALFGGFSSDERDSSGGIIGLIVISIVAPLAATLIQLAISRSREYAADSDGAKFSGNPLYLAGALSKLEQASKFTSIGNAGEATAHLFIINPLRSRSFAALFSTHPSTEERIARLKKMVGKI